MLVLLGMILVICIIIGIYTTLYNKLQDYIIRINEVEANIDNHLRNKYDTINKCVSMIKGNDKIEEEKDKKMFEEIVRLRTKKISTFDLDRKLIEAENNFLTLKEKYDFLKESKEFVLPEIEGQNYTVDIKPEITKKPSKKLVLDFERKMNK